MERDAETAALEAANKMFEVEETETDESQVTPEGEATEGTETEEEPLFPEYEIELPEDLLAELAAPTDEEIQEELENDEEYEELDEEGRKLLARAKAAEREAKTLRDLRAKNERKNWEAEAKKFFPLSEPTLESIKSDSRRGFLRQAQAAHEQVLPFVKKAQDEFRDAKEKAVVEAKAEAKAEAEKQWGKPVESRQPTEAVISQEQLDRNRSRGDFASTVRAMIFPKPSSES